MNSNRDPRSTFNEDAALYDEARPGYPDAAFADLLSITGLEPPSHVLEIGAGTGHATLPLARRGFRIDCVELGAEMAALACQRLAEFSAVTITVADFDRWTVQQRYRLVFAASAYHWLNPHGRVTRISTLLGPGGFVAVLRNFHVQGEASAGFNASIQQIYARLFPASKPPRGLHRPEDVVPEASLEWAESGVFSNVQTRTYAWQQRLTAEQYARNLATHSDHRLLSPEVRSQLFAQISHCIDHDFHGIATKQYLTLLEVAQKIS